MYFNYTLTYFIQLNCVSEDIAWGSVFESQSQQLVAVTFVSYFKSSFHSKLKILLLAVTFSCDWLCDTVKKWKLDLRLAVCTTVIETCCSTGRRVWVCVSICNKDFSHFIKTETSSPPTLTDLSVVFFSILNLSATISSVILKLHGKRSVSVNYNV